NHYGFFTQVSNLILQSTSIFIPSRLYICHSPLTPFRPVSRAALNSACHSREKGAACQERVENVTQIHIVKGKYGSTKIQLSPA
ncbi:MAG: hypothetical protein ACLUIO_20730, partial [Neglectibacter timonensis]